MVGVGFVWYTSSLYGKHLVCEVVMYGMHVVCTAGI